MLFNQAYTYFILLSFARLAWGSSSAKYAFKRYQKAPVDAIAVALHWIWYGTLLITSMPLGTAVAYFFVSQAACGLFLAAVFSLNHNGMPIYSTEESKDFGFYKMQVLTGRDVVPGLLTTWFTGNLSCG
jgi:fatty acid desaturase